VGKIPVMMVIAMITTTTTTTTMMMTMTMMVTTMMMMIDFDPAKEHEIDHEMDHEMDHEIDADEHAVACGVVFDVDNNDETERIECYRVYLLRLHDYHFCHSHFYHQHYHHQCHRRRHYHHHHQNYYYHHPVHHIFCVQIAILIDTVGIASLMKKISCTSQKKAGKKSEMNRMMTLIASYAEKRQSWRMKKMKEWLDR
jgi:hypothetical protein